MTFNETVAKVKANPQASYVGFFMRGDTYLGFYIISGEEEEPGWVNVQFEGGELFSSSGEENFYDLGTAPDEVKQLKYLPQEQCPDAAGYSAEHVANQLFAELADPQSIMSHQERSAFAKAARECMASEWVTF